MEARCGHCRFFKTSSGERPQGVCLRYPPMVASGNRPPAWAWPEVHAIHWCGECEWKKG